MPQSSLTIGNVDGPVFRGALNDTFEAIATKQSGASEPSTPRAFMWWADTANGLLKLRNANNSAWLTVGDLTAANFGLASLTANTFTGTQNFADNTAQRPRLVDYSEAVNVLGSISGATDVDLESGNVATAAIAGDVTFTFSGVGSGVAHAVTLYLTGAGDHSITWPASVKWAGGVVPILGDSDWLSFVTVDGGSSWYGFTLIHREPTGFPTVVSVTGSSFASASLSHNVTIPVISTSVGDLLVCIIQHTDGNGIDTGVGAGATWTALRAGARSSVFVKVADGTEGSTENFQTNVATTAAAQVYVVDNWFGTLAGVEINSEVAGASSAPNPGLVTASWGSGRNLFIAHCTASDDDETVDSAPSNYTGLVSTVSGGGVNNGGTVGSAYRELESANDNPGVFGLSGIENWGAAVVVVRQAS